MQHFYGKLFGRAKTPATRVGTKESGLSARLYTRHGDLNIKLSVDYETERDWLTIEWLDNSIDNCVTLYIGPAPSPKNVVNDDS